MNGLRLLNLGSRAVAASIHDSIPRNDSYDRFLKSDDQKWNKRIENPCHCTKKLANTFEMM
jgi:hypothetical protein